MDNLDTILQYLNPETIEQVATYIVSLVVVVGASIGKVRRAVINACKKAVNKEPKE